MKTKSILIAACVAFTMPNYSIPQDVQKLRTAMRLNKIPFEFAESWHDATMTCRLVAESEFLKFLGDEPRPENERVLLVGYFDFPSGTAYKKRESFHVQLQLDGNGLYPFVVSIPPKTTAQRIPFIANVDFILPPTMSAKQRGPIALLPGKELKMFISYSGETSKNGVQHEEIKEPIGSIRKPGAELGRAEVEQ